MSDMLAKKLEEADRMLRRGEFESARSAYVALLGYASGAEAETLRARIASVDDLIGPLEGSAAPPPPPAAGPTPQQQAEEAVNEGRVDDAIDLYAGIMAGHPDDLLAKERLTELLAMKSKAMRSRLSASTTSSRVLTAQDTLNASIAGEHESGPLGKALDGAKSKSPHGPPAAPVEAPVELEEFDVEMDMDVEVDAAPPAPRPPPPPVPAAPPAAARQGGQLLGEAPRTPVPVSNDMVALPSAFSPAPPSGGGPPAPPPAPRSATLPPFAGTGLPSDVPSLLRELLNRVQANRRAPSRLTPFPG